MRSPGALDLAGRVVLVTGAGRGIGLAAARLLGEQGARLVLHDVSVERLETAVAALNGAEVVTVTGDARDERAAQLAVALAVERFGGVDVLVNNVGGLVAPAKDPVEVSLAEFEDSVALNLLTAVAFTRAVVPIMRERGGGKIVNVSSALAVRGVREGHIGYDAGKGCICGLTRALALELAGDGIIVNAVAPSSVMTETSKEMGYDDPALYASYPLGRASQPEEVGGVVAFLASGWAGYVTGETIVVSGGQFIGSSQV